MPRFCHARDARPRRVSVASGGSGQQASPDRPRRSPSGSTLHAVQQMALWGARSGLSGAVRLALPAVVAAPRQRGQEAGRRPLWRGLFVAAQPGQRPPACSPGRATSVGSGRPCATYEWGAAAAARTASRAPAAGPRQSLHAREPGQVRRPGRSRAANRPAPLAVPPARARLRVTGWTSRKSPD